MFENLIIPVAPKLDIYPEATMRHTDDTPTVAENFLPYATAQDAPLNEADNKFSYGKLWKAYMQDKTFLLEM